MGIHSKNILLTDDNPVNQQVASWMLQKLGHEVIIASSGVEALEAIRSRPFDLVLMDIMMPEMDGITTSQEIRLQLGATCPPIIALTANAEVGDKRECLEAGMDGFLSKPFTIQQLRASVDAYLEHDNDPASDALNLPVFQTFVKSMGEDDVDFLQELFADFLTEANRVRAEIHSGIDKQNMDVIARACHSLKGSAALLGASPLQSISDEFERLANRGKLNDILMRMSHFEGCINAIRSALDAEMEELILKSQS